MKKVAKRFFESKQILGQLSILFNARVSLNSKTNTFEYNWSEIDISDMFKDEDRIYAVEIASKRRIEVSKYEFENDYVK